MSKATLIAAAVIFVFGGMVGNALHDNEVKVVKGDETVKTVVKTETETVVKEVLPDTCQRALDLMVNIHSGAKGIYNSSTEQIDIISTTRKAIAMGTDLSDPENKLLKLKNKLSGHVADLGTEFGTFEELVRECEGKN